MKRLFAVLTILFSCVAVAQNYRTVAEKTDYKKTSLHKEIMDLIYYAQSRSEYIKVSKLCTTGEGRLVPLVIVSKEGISSPSEMGMTGKYPVLVMANIHAGEIEGKEAVLKFIRDVAEGRELELLENQIILIIPDFNADGNEKLAKDNRRDNGPDYAGIRYNSQNLDMNRDYIKAESIEIKALLKLFQDWDPVLFLDMHTKDGSYHQEPVTYATSANPNAHSSMSSYMWKKMFPEVRTILKKKYNYESLPYGNFMDRGKPSKGWINNTVNARFGTNYTGLRNRFTILDENYPWADFKTRVLSSYGFMRSVLDYTNRNIKEMRAMTWKADRDTVSDFSSGKFVMTHKVEKLFDVTVKSYKFKKVKITEKNRHKYPWWYRDYFMEKLDEKKNYTMPYYAGSSPVKTIELPEGYILDPSQKVVAEKLKIHGIVVKRIIEPADLELEEYMMSSVKPAKGLYQGRVFIKVEGKYKKIRKRVEKGSYFVSLKQPLGRLAAVMLEPEYDDSLLAWGYFNRFLVTQWGNRPAIYPVYRIHSVKQQKLRFIR